MSKEIYIVSPGQMHDIILRPTQNKPERYLCLDYIRDAKGITLIAIDNTTCEAWTEEFSSVPEAEAWLLAEPWPVKRGQPEAAE